MSLSDSVNDDMLRLLRQQIYDRVSAQQREKHDAFEHEKQAMKDAKNARQQEKKQPLESLREIARADLAHEEKKRRLEHDYHDAVEELGRSRDVWLARLDGPVPDTSSVSGRPSTSRQTPATPVSRSSYIVEPDELLRASDIEAPCKTEAQEPFFQFVDAVDPVDGHNADEAFPEADAAMDYASDMESSPTSASDIDSPPTVASGKDETVIDEAPADVQGTQADGVRDNVEEVRSDAEQTQDGVGENSKQQTPSAKSTSSSPWQRLAAAGIGRKLLHALRFPNDTEDDSDSEYHGDEDYDEEHQLACQPPQKRARLLANRSRKPPVPTGDEHSDVAQEVQPRRRVDRRPRRVPPVTQGRENATTEKVDDERLEEAIVCPVFRHRLVTTTNTVMSQFRRGRRCSLGGSISAKNDLLRDLKLMGTTMNTLMSNFRQNRRRGLDLDLSGGGLVRGCRPQTWTVRKPLRNFP